MSGKSLVKQKHSFMDEDSFLSELSYSNGESKVRIGGNYCFARITDRNRPLLVAFTNMGVSVSESEFCSPNFSAWGDRISLANNVNIISFGCLFKDNWYRDTKLIEFLRKVGKATGGFPVKLGYGGSMGGYAVGAFSGILGLDRVLLLNPISSLSKDLVPWEKRFREFTSLNWDSELADGANVKVPGFVVYDPLFDLDTKHAKRYGVNIKLLKCPGVGHAMPKHLIRIGVLKDLFKYFVQNQISSEWFHRSVRRRKLYTHYYEWLLCSENTHLTPKRKAIIKSHQRALAAYLDESPKMDEDVLVSILKEASMKVENDDKIKGNTED